MRLETAIKEYLGYRRGTRKKPSTLLKDEQCLTALLKHYGEIEVDILKDVDSFFVDFVGSASYLNSHVSVFRSFFAWCRQRGYMPYIIDPMYGREHAPNPPKVRKYVPVDQFPDLLDAADHPRDRAVIALGLYLFLRQGEITTLRVGDLDWTHIGVRVWKTNQSDRMQINSELRVEMDRWLRHYADEAGPLDPDWLLVPARGQGFARMPLRPTEPFQRPYRATQRALERLGWTDDEIDGEGGHLLRRSGARALYFQLRDGEGNERALALVQRRLHHASRAMTERYIGLTMDDADLDHLLVGRPMFPEVASNVIPFRRREA